MRIPVNILLNIIQKNNLYLNSMGISENRHYRDKYIKKRSKVWKNCNKGKLSKNNFSCGCQMCKPWKHKLENRLKPSDRKKLG